MITVQLSTPQGIKLNSFFDDEDAHIFNDGKWRVHKLGGGHYVRGYRGRNNILAHRLILGCIKGDGKVVDHIDGNPLNNQKANLRICTHAQNSWNKHKCNSKTGFIGVSEARDGMYIGKLKHRGKYYYCGYHLTPVNAALAVNEKMVELRGEYAAPNLIKDDQKITSLQAEKSNLELKLKSVNEALYELVS